MNSHIEKTKRFFLLLSGLAVLMAAPACTAAPFMSLEELAQKSWEVDELVGNNPFCKSLLQDWKTNIGAFQEIPPLVETDNWNDPELQKHLAGCKKEDYVETEEMKQISMGKGEYIWAPGGTKKYSIEHFALWELNGQVASEGKRDYILYVGPRYVMKDMNGKPVRKYLNWGTMHEIEMPPCKRIGIQSGGNFARSRKEPPPRGSRLIRYKNRIIWMILREYGDQEKKYSISFDIRRGDMKEAAICKIKHNF